MKSLSVNFIYFSMFFLLLFCYHTLKSQDLNIIDLNDNIYINTEDLSSLTSFLEKKGYYYKQNKKNDDYEKLYFEHDNNIDKIIIINNFIDKKSINYGIAYLTRRDNFIKIKDSFKKYDFIKEFKSYIDSDGFIVILYGIINDGIKTVYELKNKGDEYIIIIHYMLFQEYNDYIDAIKKE